jgi:polyhydroxyalkanoate synthase
MRAITQNGQWRDEVRRAFGRAVDAIGFGPQETPYRVVAKFLGARLRAYFQTGDTSGPVLLIIPAPYKGQLLRDFIRG